MHTHESYEKYTEITKRLNVLNDNVLIHCKIELPKSEVVTEGGIVIQQDPNRHENLKLPTVGRIIAVGEAISEETKLKILGKLVVLPSGKFYQCPDLEDMDMDPEDYKNTEDRYVYAKYSSLFLVINDNIPIAKE